MNILIVDDHKSIVDEMIEKLGDLRPNAVCTGITRPSVVMQLLLEQQFDIVFMDIEMPGINGIKLAEKILAEYPRTNIIYITGFTEYAFDSYRTFASAFLAKPITKTELKNALNNLRYPVSDITDDVIEQTYQGKALIGRKLEKLIIESGMSKQELADKLGVQFQTIYRWINGERLPDLPMTLKIMKVLGIDKDKLL